MRVFCRWLASRFEMAISTKPVAAVADSKTTSLAMPKMQLKKAVGDRERKFFTEQMALLLERGRFR